MKPTPSRTRACVFLALLFLSGAGTAFANSIVLAIPDQSVAAPSSGTISVDYTGTVTISPDYISPPALVDNPFNSANTIALVATLDSAFETFLLGVTSSQGRTYTGSIFNLQVLSLTPPDLYGFKVGGDPSVVTLRLTTAVTLHEFTAPFSLNVTGPNGPPPGGNHVPENGASVLLLGCSLAALCLLRRVLT